CRRIFSTCRSASFSFQRTFLHCSEDLFQLASASSNCPSAFSNWQRTFFVGSRTFSNWQSTFSNWPSVLVQDGRSETGHRSLFFQRRRRSTNWQRSFFHWRSISPRRPSVLLAKGSTSARKEGGLKDDLLPSNYVNREGRDFV